MKGNIYNKKELMSLLEEGIISTEEEGFMQGYIAG